MGEDQGWTDNPLYEAASWQGNPAYESPWTENAAYEGVDWQENPEYQAPDETDAALDGVARLFPSEARLAFDSAMHARPQQERVPIDTNNPMESPDVMKGYVASSLGAREAWDEMSDDKRRSAITGPAGRAAAQAHPGLNVTYADAVLDEGVQGMTDPWSGRVDTQASGFAIPALDADTVDTIYHETTHAEQVALVKDVKGRGGPVTNREVDINYEMNVNLGTSIENPEPDTTLWVEKHARDGEADYQAYRGLRAEKEAHAAGEAAGRMFTRVSDVHDELRERFAAQERREDLAELPQLEPGD